MSIDLEGRVVLEVVRAAIDGGPEDWSDRFGVWSLALIEIGRETLGERWVEEGAILTADDFGGDIAEAAGKAAEWIRGGDDGFSRAVSAYNLLLALDGLAMASLVGRGALHTEMLQYWGDVTEVVHVAAFGQGAEGLSMAAREVDLEEMGAGRRRPMRDEEDDGDEDDGVDPDGSFDAEP